LSLCSGVVACEPPSVEVMVAAYSEWVTSAEFSASYSVQAGVSLKSLRGADDHGAVLRTLVNGVLVKRGDYWRMSNIHTRPALHVAAASQTSPGAMRYVSWERLCSDGYVLNYFPGDGLEQAGLSSRVFVDGRRSAEFHSACVNEQSILNPVGTEVFDDQSGEWCLPGVTRGMEIEWSSAPIDSSRVELVGVYGEAGARDEVRYVFRTDFSIPVIEAIHRSQREGSGYEDFLLSGFRASTNGLEYPTRMEFRRFPVRFTKSDGDTAEATSVRVWQLQFSEALRVSDTDFGINFQPTTVFTGFQSQPANRNGFSLIGFRDKFEDTEVAAPPRRSVWLMWLNVAMAGLLCVWWLGRRRNRRRLLPKAESA